MILAFDYEGMENQIFHFFIKINFQFKRTLVVLKNKNHLIRIGLVILICWLVIFKTYQFKYTNFIFDGIIYLLIVVIGLIVLGIILLKDLKLFEEKRQIKYLISSMITATSVIIVLGISWHINKIFSKPTLLNVYYNGDFNGTGIDFKEDGTYIFDNYCLGSDYKYGTYQINGNEIELDTSQIDNVISSKRLKIMSKEVSYYDEVKEENYVFQIDEFGNVLEDETIFRVTMDNRKR